MIDLVTDGDRSGFGLRTALSLAGIPWRQREHVDAGGHGLVVVGRPLDAAETRALGRRPTLLVGTAGALMPGGGSAARVVCGVSLPLDEPIWSERTRAVASDADTPALLLPHATAALPGRLDAATRIVARLRDAGGDAHPTVLARGRIWWCGIDLGTALTDLLDERWFGAPARDGRRVPRPVLAAYYAMPEALRAPLQRTAHRRLARRASAHPGPSRYPVDASGWLILELLQALVRRSAGWVVRVAPWPAPFEAAAVLTHDVEPSRYAERRGLRRLLGARRGARPAPAVGLVAARAAAATDSTALASCEVYCHGLEHRGETLAGTPADVAARLVRARQALEAHLGREVAGFRSPRLARSPVLLHALDRAGFAWDSSYPDVDRETVALHGGGVRLGLPYRPPIDDRGQPRPSRCLELPVSAPDCIQPLLAGAETAALRDAVRRKLAFVRRTGGLYVGIVHAGVFGERDALRRLRHLRWLRHLLREPALWRAAPSEVVAWWRAREAVEVRVGTDALTLVNRGDTPVSGVRLLIEDAAGERILTVPPLAPGGTITLTTGRAATGADASPARAHGA